MDDFEPYPCPTHPDEMVTGECLDPYAQDVFGEEVLMPNCAKCVQEHAEDI